MVDPQDLHWFGQPVTLSRTGVYTLAFLGSGRSPWCPARFTTLLAMSPFELNRCPVPDEERPDDCRKHPPVLNFRRAERGMVGCVSKVLGSCLAPLSKIFQWQACWLFTTMRRKASVSRIRTWLCLHFHGAFFHELGERAAHGFKFEGRDNCRFLLASFATPVLIERSLARAGAAPN